MKIFTLLFIHSNEFLIFKVSSADESAANLASGLHTSWRHSEWCKNNAFFKLDQTTGQIIVPEDGLYLVYVQV